MADLMRNIYICEYNANNKKAFGYYDYVDFYENLEAFFTVSGIPYGYQYLQDISFRDCVGFVSDYYAIKFLVANSMLSGFDVVNVLTAISNLLRLCEANDINEIFISSLRLKRSIQGNWVIIER